MSHLVIEKPNAFSNPMAIRTLLLGLKYEDSVSPYDGSTYPTISMEVPKVVQDEFRRIVEEQVGKPLFTAAMASRLNLEGSSNPQPFHNDEVMGKYSAIVYLSLPEHCQGGTGLVEHVDGTKRTYLGGRIEQYVSDGKDQSKWSVWRLLGMEFNKLVIFDSRLFHVAYPMNGFGKSVNDGRLALVGFFNE